MAENDQWCKLTVFPRNSGVVGVEECCGNENNNNQSTMVQASKPQVSDAEIKLTQAPMPFIRTIENQYLSISPRNNKLPPEIARMIQ